MTVDDREAGELIALFVGILAFPVALYVLWKIEREQADAVLDNIRWQVRTRHDEP